jgi:predicted permease
MSQQTPSWRRYLRFWGTDVEADLRDEFTFHLDAEIEQLVAEGMTPEAARAEALRRFGDVERYREFCRQSDERRVGRRARILNIASITRDVRYAWRSLRKQPSFALTAIACIALGLCATTTIFSAVNAILLRPLPYPDADRLVSITSENKPRDYHGVNVSYQDYVSWRDGNRAFSSMGIWTWVTKTMTTGETERMLGASVSANLFPTLGVRPVLGRNFVPEEEVVAASDVLLLSHGLWQRRFGSDSSIVGKTISVDGRSHRVIGVMPPGFRFPARSEFWMPFATDQLKTEPHGNRGYAGAIGRMKPGVTFEQAKADLGTIDARLAREFKDNVDWNADVKTLRDDLVGDLKRPTLVFLGAGLLVLLIACANVANLLLVRGITRQREIAVRSALGAGRGDLLRQLLVESLLLSAVGGVVGAAAGFWTVRLVRFAFPNGVPFYLTFDPDIRVFAAAIVVIALTALLAGVVPAVQSTRLDINRTLRDGGRGGESLARSRGRQMLVVAELALSTLLLIGGTLLLRSYRAYINTDLGFERNGILTTRVTLPEISYDETARRIRFFEDLEQRVRAIPGVTMVGSAQGIPFSGWNTAAGIAFADRPMLKAADAIDAHYQGVFPEFFTAMGVRLSRGRMLSMTDRDTLAPVVVANETLVQRVYPNENPIGKRLKFGDANSPGPWYTIVGVVRDFRHYELPQPMLPAVYLPYTELPGRSQTLVIRTNRADPYELVPAIRAALQGIDPQVALYDIRTMEDQVSQSLWRQRLQSQVLGVFALLAVGLAIVGMYGLISYGVAQRQREIGVRLALGAKQSTVMGLVLREGLVLAGAGLAIGMVASLMLTRAITSLIHGVSASDPITYVLVGTLLLAVAVLSSMIPARRAATVDPIVAMRAD